MDKILTMLFFLICQGLHAQMQIVSPPVKEKSDFFLCVRIVPLTDAANTLYLYIHPINNTDSLSFNKLLNDFENSIVFDFDIPSLYEPFTKNKPIKEDNDSTFMISSLFSYSRHQNPFFHSAFFDVYVFFVKADVEYRVVKNLINLSFLKFNFINNTISVEEAKLPRFYDMKVLTGFTWKDDSVR